MDYRQQLKRDLEDEDQKKKLAYLRSCDENERKMEERQENYKKHFYDYDRNLQERQKLYEKQVLSPQNEKIKQRIDWEQNGSAIYKEILAQREAKKQQDLNTLKHNCLDSLQTQMDFKELRKRQQREEAEMEKRLADMKELQLKEEDKQKKEEAKRRQELYNQALNYQVNLHEVAKHNYGKMTLHEKHANKQELKNYKQQNPQVTTMIPGLNNTQGGTHLVRTHRRAQVHEPGRLGMSLNGPVSNMNELQPGGS